METVSQDEKDESLRDTTILQFPTYVRPIES
jgi:hypothetical protein